MAGYNNYGNRGTQQTNTQAPAPRGNYSKAPAAGASKDSGDKISVTGLYPHESKSGQKTKLLFTGKVREAVTIPAGYTIKVFEAGGKSKNGKDLPPMQVVAQAPISRS